MACLTSRPLTPQVGWGQRQTGEGGSRAGPAPYVGHPHSHAGPNAQKGTRLVPCPTVMKFFIVLKTRFHFALGPQITQLVLGGVLEDQKT